MAELTVSIVAQLVELTRQGKPRTTPLGLLTLQSGLLSTREAESTITSSLWLLHAEDLDSGCTILDQIVATRLLFPARHLLELLAKSHFCSASVTRIQRMESKLRYGGHALCSGKLILVYTDRVLFVAWLCSKCSCLESMLRRRVGIGENSAAVSAAS